MGRYQLDDATLEAMKKLLSSTKEWFEKTLRTELTAFELRINDRIVASERATRSAIFGAYTMVIGTYALIIAAIFVNHFWR
jgi:hypothetical protein